MPNQIETTPKPNILVVDDTPANLRLLTELLIQHGYDVRPAPNGNLALKTVASKLPDLILLDIMMPDIDGYEVCRRLKASKHSCDIPIIFISAINETMDKVKAFSIGGIDYITKPFEPEEVLARIQTHLAIRVMQQKLEIQNTQLQQEIAERKLSEEQLITTRNELVQSEKMASLGRLVAGFAHELNTPIGVAIGSASTLQTEVKKINGLMAQEEIDVDELLSALDSIDKGADLTLSNLERAANLVISFKRTAVDQTSGEVRTFHVHEVINDTINTLHNRFKNTEIEISIDCPKALKIKSMPGALEQIITNLMMNSLIHGFDEGKNAGQINIKVQLENNKLQLEYSDTGKGIAPENVEKIFEPFFTTYRAQGGSGLGMYICYNLVINQLHGTMICESTDGKGIKFVIHYPIKENGTTENVE
jgi:two-component system, NtrC family, sensor kinase